MINLNPEQKEEVEKLVDLIKQLNAKGHNLATSGNYSLCFSTLENFALVSESGIDKANFQAHNFLPVHKKNKTIHTAEIFQGRKSSDETAIHLAIYNHHVDAKCVLHSHFLETILLAKMYPKKDFLTVNGLEMIKAFAGIKSHEEQIEVAFFDNTQDIETLSTKIGPVLEKHPEVRCILLRDHGVYVWGKSVLEAKRHLEALEYIFKYYIELKKMNLN